MSGAWVLVADSGRARIFQTGKGHGELSEVEDLLNPAAREHERDLTADGKGRTFDRGGEGRHAMEDRTTMKEHETESFAARVSDFLEAGRNDGHVSDQIHGFSGSLRPVATASGQSR